jgi:hypothetical protein
MLEMLNGSPKCTVIERMDGTVKVIGPLMEKDQGCRMTLEFQNLGNCKDELTRKGWEANVAFVKKIVRHEEQSEK